mgnify:CR=1 FL=1
MWVQLMLLYCGFLFKYSCLSTLLNLVQENPGKDLEFLLSKSLLSLKVSFDDVILFTVNKKNEFS